MRRFLTALAVLSTFPAAAQVFRPEPIRAHMTFLASDLLEGRGTGTRGHQLAADYVAAQFEAYGLAPNPAGSYFQSVPFLKTLVQADSTMTVQRGRQAATTVPLGSTFMTSGNPLAGSSTIKGDVVFAGYGITAAGSSYDDYKGLDVRGKIVLLFSGAPASFANTLRAHYSSSLSKIENAASHGAIGIVFVSSPDEYARVPWDRVVRQTKLGAMHWLNAAGQPHGVFSAIPMTVSLSRPGAEALFAGSRQTYARASEALVAGKARRGPLGVHVIFDIRSVHARVESPNVVGVIRGSDPKLRDEYVVISSHLDHLGISDPVNGDAINNGALDNASGIAIILEIARALVTSNPRRSIVFVATTGEEKGLRGADYYANNPTVPYESIVANVNIDEVYLFAPSRDITVIGAENSDLGATAERAAAAMGIELSPDPFPEEVVFVRSDQYPFVRRGIPAIFPIAGNRAADGKTDLRALQQAWNRTRYHQPGDDMNQPLDYRPGVQMAEFGTRVVLDIANREGRPQWNKGNFFGELFGRR